MRHTLTALAFLGLMFPARADDWPQWMGPQRDNVWRETGILDKFPAGGPKIVWRAKVAGGYSGPAVANGRVYVGDFVSPADPKKETYERTGVNGTERVLCFDEKTGKSLWTFEYPTRYSVSFPTGPRTTPCVNDGRVYFLGTEGRLSCLDAETGKVIWQKDYPKDYGAKTPLWGFAGHPFVDGDKVYCIVGGEGACVVAFDKKTGAERWKSLNAAEPGYSTPTMIEAGGKRQLLIFHAESVNGLDPETGKRLWNVKLKAGNGAAIMSPVRDGDYLFAGAFHTVCKGMKLNTDRPGADELWTGDKKSGLYPVNGQPFAEDGVIYGNCQDGELRCIEIATGKRLWETLDPLNGKGGQCATVFLVKHADRFFLFTDQGELIIAKLSKAGYREIDRAKVIEPTGYAMGREVIYSMPAFASKRMFIRNDKELICVALEKE
ncbi:MAG TPA: PQQ-binding-like beta-propeller repeat protein [Gemmataceae bacterium]|nr:PQQ-binding-like beta-propeller repeat protein [Gemmataceae bacterium]